MADEWDDEPAPFKSDTNNNDTGRKFGFGALNGKSSFGNRDSNNNEGGNRGFANRDSNNNEGGSRGFGGKTGGNSCYNCGDSGHMSRECPNPKKERPPREGGNSCYNCGDSGHMSRECPNPKKERTPREGGFGNNGFKPRQEGGESTRTFGAFNRNNNSEGGEKRFNGLRNKENGDEQSGDSLKSAFSKFRDNENGDSKPRSFGANGDGGDFKKRFGSTERGSGGGNSCYNCGDSGHMSRECPNPKKERPPREGGNSCYNCGDSGHMSRDCPNPKKERPPREGGNSCYNCGDSGHMSRECPNPKKERPPKEGVEGDERKERYIPPNIEDNELFEHTIATGVNFKKQAEIQVNLSGENATEIKAIDRFSDAPLSELLMENIKKSKYEIPTPVQRYSIPVMLQRRDLMACAQTGSGKTAAYLIPIMTNILQDGIASSAFAAVQEPQALILAPTRELARQIYVECKKFSFESMIKCNVVYGGTVTGHQLNEISRGTNILVATPGRLLDILNKEKISFDKLKYIVLDEADRMLDFGFESAIREILGKCKLQASERCTFMFSATFPKEIQTLAKDFLNNYLFLTVGVVGGANTDVEQRLIQATRLEKREKLFGILNEIGNERTMVFVEHKKQADILAFLLIEKGYPTTSIHGDRLQSQRETALVDFKTGTSKVIVCTSVAARGLDISQVNHVINFDLPQTIDEYVHRIGRTGRCGNLGKAVSFFDPDSENDRKLARALVSVIMGAGKEVPDWLHAVADDSVGSGFNDGKCVEDLRTNFKSLAVNTAPVAATTGGDDSWD